MTLISSGRNGTHTAGVVFREGGAIYELPVGSDGRVYLDIKTKAPKLIYRID